MARSAVDPVCGMTVDAATAPAKAEYQGQLFYFCSKQCKAKFQTEPEKYSKQSVDQP